MYHNHNTNYVDTLYVSEIKQKRISGGVNIKGTTFENNRVDISGSLRANSFSVGKVDDVESILLHLIDSNKQLTEKVNELENELKELKYHPKSPFIQDIAENWNSKYFRGDEN